MAKTVAILGSGDVGKTLANGFLKNGYRVILASRNPSKLDDWLKTAEPKESASIATFADAAAEGDIIVFAIIGVSAVAALEQIGIDNLKGKTVIDTTNPISGPPGEDGLFEFFAGTKDSLMEALQDKAPEAKFVKAFNSCGYAQMVNPDYGNVKPTMFICGNDAGAKADVKTVLDLFGWEACDLGGVKAARAIEPLCQLWCIRGLGQGKFQHAFKLLTKDEL